MSVTQEHFKTMLKLQEHLEKKMPLAPIKYIFSLPDGKEITRLDEFATNRSYIVSKDRKPGLADVRYGYSTEQHWVTKPPSGGKVRASDIEKLYKSEPPANSPTKNRRIITIYKNKKWDRKEKVILNPNADIDVSFRDMLDDWGFMMSMVATGLFLYKKPELKVIHVKSLVVLTGC